MKFLLVSISLFSFIFGQVSFTGNVVSSMGESRNGYYYNESLINTQIQFGRFYNWLQFEFSDPPELGREYNGLRKLRLEYLNGPLQIKLGDMYEIWGRGLILNSLDDQSIDRDSGIRGIGIVYETDAFNIHFLSGQSDYSMSTIYSPGYNSRTPNYTTTHNLYGVHTEWQLDSHLAGLTFLQSKEAHPVNTFPEDTLDIKNRLLGAHYIYNNSLIDVYVEYVKNWSTLLNEENDGFTNYLDGRALYGNVNLYFSLFSLNLEYINYRFGTLDPLNRWNNVDNYGIIQHFQNPPISGVIGSTTLINRTTHQTDFNNEVGYKLEILGSIRDDFEYYGFISRSSRSNTWFINNEFEWEKEGQPVILPQTDPAASPYKAYYGEISGYFFDYALHTMIGYSYSEDMIDLAYYSKTDTSKNMNYTYQSAKTIPLHTSFIFSNGWSIEAKIETQWLKKGIWRFEELNGNIIADSLISEFLDVNENPIGFQQNTFMSISVGKSPNWTMAFTLDKISTTEPSFGLDQKDDSSNSLESLLGLNMDQNWANIEFVYNVTPSFRLSLMYGSLKGGLLCANGVCRIIEPFENGFKMGITAAF